MWGSFKRYVLLSFAVGSFIFLPSCGFFGKKKEAVSPTLKPVKVLVFGNLNEKIKVSNPVVTRQGDNTVIQFVVTNKTGKRLTFLYKVYPYDINGMLLNYPQNGWNQGYLDPSDSEVFTVVLPVSIQRISKVEIRIKNYVGY
jgi:uncharacterized protein YcfL